MKDRLHQLRQIIKDKPPSVEEPQIEIDDEEENETSLFLKDFLPKVEATQELLYNIKIDIVEIKKKHKVILSSTTNGELLETELDILMKKVSSNANKIKNSLKSIEKDIKDESPQNNPVGYRIKKCQHATLSREFVDVMTDYSNVQNEYRDACTTRIKRQLTIAKQSYTDEQVEEMIENKESTIFTQGIVTDTQQAKKSLREIEARHNDIIKLENSIKELHELFTDLALIIISQGEMIDRIEYNIEKTVDYVHSAVLQTKKALHYQSGARKKKIIVAIILAIVIVVVIVVIVLVKVVKW